MFWASAIPEGYEILESPGDGVVGIRVHVEADIWVRVSHTWRGNWTIGGVNAISGAVLRDAIEVCARSIAE